MFNPCQMAGVFFWKEFNSSIFNYNTEQNPYQD